jgi:predicted kinase
MLIVFAGLPGVGKTAIARELARQIGATYLRIDSIEQCLRDSMESAEPMNDSGYRIAYAMAEDNLRLGRTVVADCVNPLGITRDAWNAVAQRARVPLVEVEILCSDIKEHRRRVETRMPDIPGLRPLSWEDVVSREYHAWDRKHIVIDTAGASIGESVRRLGLKLTGS